MKDLFSIVIPVYNEDESLRELLTEIKKNFSGKFKNYEVVFVDDGSQDRTLDILKEFEKKEKNIRVYAFRRNLGKSRALMLGLQRAKGEYMISLDADLQDDPKNISTLFQKMNKGGYDLVTGWRKQRQDPFFKIYSSKLFNSTVSFLFGVKIHDLNSGLKLYRKDLAKNLQLYGGMHRFIPVIAHEMGYKIGEKEILHHPRKYGKSKYKFTKIFTDIPDLITIYFLTKYNRRPLHFFGKIGTFIFGIGILILLYFTIEHYFFGQTVGRRPLFFIGILFILAGIQTVFTGLIADLIVNLSDKESLTNFPTKYESSE